MRIRESRSSQASNQTLCALLSDMRHADSFTHPSIPIHKQAQRSSSTQPAHGFCNKRHERRVCVYGVAVRSIAIESSGPAVFAARCVCITVIYLAHESAAQIDH